MSTAQMGSLSWGATSGGQLSEAEQLALVRNVASMRAGMVFDECRHRLGLLRPVKLDLRTLEPPDSKLVRDADALARATYDDVLWAHCMRTFYFGALVAAYEGVGFDREQFYAAAICHDVGVNESEAGAVAGCCFAQSGGRLVCDRLAKAGHGASAKLIGDAIAVHMNLVVPAAEYSTEASLLAVGATCDIFGAHVRKINGETLCDVVRTLPRDGLFEAFGPFLSKKHLSDTRTDLLVRMGAFESQSMHPIEQILAECY